MNENGGATKVPVDDVTLGGSDAQRDAMDAAVLRVHEAISTIGGSGAAPVQMRREPGEQTTAPDVRSAAARGVGGGGTSLPHAARIQAAFGRHSVAGVRAHMGTQAQAASRAIGASAYAMGESVAFSGAPDLHTAAHEAAHVVQQRAGVALTGGVGQAGDRYERHADAVADAVVRGADASGLLDQMAGPSTGQTHGLQLLEGDTRTPDDRIEPTRHLDAALALDDLSQAIARAEETIRAWQCDVWNQVLSITGTRPDLGLTRAKFDAIFMKPLAASSPGVKVTAPPGRGDALAGLGDAAANTLAGVGIAGAGNAVVARVTVGSGAQVGRVITTLSHAFKGAGVPGFVLGTLVNIVWSFVSDLVGGDSDLQEARLEGAKTAIDYRARIDKKLSERARESLEQWAQDNQLIRGAIQASRSAAELDAIAAALRAHAALLDVGPPERTPLVKELVEMWVLQHTRNDERPISTYHAGTHKADPESMTDEVTYDLARQKLQSLEHAEAKTNPSGAGSAQAPGAIARTDLFMHQTALALARLGLELDEPLAVLGAAFRSVASSPPERVVAVLDQVVTRASRFVDPELFVKSLPSGTSFLAPLYRLPEKPLEAVIQGNVIVECRLSLKVSGRSVVVRRWEFTASPREGAHVDDYPDGCTERMPSGLFKPRTWTSTL